MKNASLTFFKVATLAILLVSSASFAFAWTPPAPGVIPPQGGNTFPPVHTGSAFQVKVGDLGLDQLFANEAHAGGCANVGCILSMGFFSAGKFKLPGMAANPKGLTVNANGDVRFFDGSTIPFTTAQSDPSTKMLTVNDGGFIKTEAIPEPTAPAIPLPVGNRDQTLRNAGPDGAANWVASDTIRNNGVDGVSISATTQIGNVGLGGLLSRGFAVLPNAIPGLAYGISGTKAQPLGIDTSTLPGAAGTDSLWITSNPTYDYTSITTNVPKVQLWNRIENKRAGVIAGFSEIGNEVDQPALDVKGTVKIVGGDPDQNKILVSTDTQGNAQWGNIKIITNDTNGGLIRYVRSTEKGGSAQEVFCGGDDAGDDANWMVVGGGGYCQFGTQVSRSVTSRNNVLYYQPGPTSDPAIGWRVDCLDADKVSGYVRNGGNGGLGVVTGRATAEVICMKKTPFVTGVTVESKGPRVWHVAPAGQAPQASATNCMGAYYQFNGYSTFIGSQVGYIKQVWEGEPGVAWSKISGPGNNTSPYDVDPGSLSDADITTGQCVIWKNTAPTYGAGVANLPGNAVWQGKTVDGSVVINPSTGRVSQTVWFTYLKY